LALAYIAGAKLGLSLSFSHEHVTAIWPPTGIAVAALMIFGLRLWPGVFVGALVANILDGAPMQTAGIIAVGNTIAPVVATALLGRLDVKPTLSKLRDVVLLTFTALGTMTISATIGTWALSLAGAIVITETWRIWWVGDSMGVILFAPLLLTAMSKPIRQSTLVRRWKQSVPLLSAFVVLVLLAVQDRSPVGYAVVPFALLVAMQLEQEGAAAAMAIMAGIDIWHVTIAPDPSMSIEHQLLTLQGVNASIALIVLAFSVVMYERRRSRIALLAAADELEDRVHSRTAALAVANERLEREAAEHLRTEMALRTSEDRFNEAQRLAKIGSFIWDAATDTNDWSDELFRIYGLEQEDGPPGFERYISFIRPDLRDEVRASVERAIGAGDSISHEYAVALDDGTEKWVHAYVEVIKDEAGQLAGLRGTCQDITERKLAVDAAFERERQAAEHLRQLDQAKNAFLSAVSHELRTPLTGIIGFTELLQDRTIRESDEMIEQLVERLGFSADRLARLLTDLLDIDRLERGILEPHRRPSLIRDLVDRALGSIDLKSHPLFVDVDDALVLVDPAQTERIVENLVTNAAKYSPEGTEIVLRARCTKDAGVELVVMDKGQGIPEEMHAMIFEPFVRGETGAFTSGTGIGLALVDRFAKLHGGRAWVEDGEDGGTAFHVELPGPPAVAAVA
jgi:PAS domain S-box-containing protein